MRACHELMKAARVTEETPSFHVRGPPRLSDRRSLSYVPLLIRVFRAIADLAIADRGSLRAVSTVVVECLPLVSP
jgi:hypothetical protein